MNNDANSAVNIGNPIDARIAQTGLVLSLSNAAINNFQKGVAFALKDRVEHDVIDVLAHGRGLGVVSDQRGRGEAELCVWAFPQ